MLDIEKCIESCPVEEPGRVPDEVFESERPLVLRGLVEHWPIVAAARESRTAVDAYLRRFYSNATVNAVYGRPEAEGRLFYDADMSGFNFEAVRVRLDKVLDDLRAQTHAAQPAGVYVGSTTVDAALPGFRSENDLQMGHRSPLVSIWLGNRSRIAAHFDVPDNVACCAAGRRRFILFPPGAIADLYPGPLDFTPAGQVISMVDFEQPDFERFPRFRAALRIGQLAELDPGDALYIPSTWWHHAQALEDLNVLINYWWRSTPAYMDTPAHVLEYALLTLRDLPRAQRDAWREIFNYYVFDFDAANVSHIPENRRGVLAPFDDVKARRLRAQLLNRLNR